jgi:hypothetical protein
LRCAGKRNGIPFGVLLNCHQIQESFLTHNLPTHGFLHRQIEELTGLLTLEPIHLRDLIGDLVGICRRSQRIAPRAWT